MSHVAPLTVTPGQALMIAGLLPPHHDPIAAEKTAYGQISKERYPFPLLRFEGTKRKYLVRIADIESTLAKMPSIAGAHKASALTAAPTTRKRPRGRPRKVAAPKQ